MKTVSIFLCLALLLPALLTTASAQRVIGTIDIYGNGSISKAAIQSALQLKEGDTLFTPTTELDKKLLQIPGIKKASTSVICCEAGKFILYTGVSETTDSVNWRLVKGSAYQLPARLQEIYSTYETALKQAVIKGDNEDDLSAGHSLMHNPEVRKIQDSMIPLANSYFAELNKVLQSSTLPDQRAIAAYIIAYYNDKVKVANAYNSAMNDPSSSVRNNIFRALRGIAEYRDKHPELPIHIETGFFIKMLHSVQWSDRDKAVFTLVALTEKRDPALLKQLKMHALQPLLEIARWKSAGHAVLAYVIAGRIAGMADDEIFGSWTTGKKERVFNAAF